MDLIRITDSVDTAVKEVLDFYRVYHSMRYVGDDLVLRLKSPLPDGLLERLNDEYAGKFLDSGRIESCAALEAENGEHADLPRLRMHFDRHNIGLLRRMVDTINRQVRVD